MKVQQYPRVSFIIPTLNAAEFLERCLQMIRRQTYPQKEIEILIVDGGSTDNTLKISKKYNATIIHNPHIFQEPGKTLGSSKAKGELLFYIDSDNILSSEEWLTEMVRPYIEEKNITGLLPQTIPDPTSHPIDQYFGYLFTDPFTWFVYGKYSNPKYYPLSYTPVKKTATYYVFKFTEENLPLFGFAQGVGVVKKLGHGSGRFSDDMLSGIHAITEGNYVAYIPNAGVYHYHITSLSEFINKYSWRVKNNLKQRYTGVGIHLRKKYFSLERKLRIYVFIPYGLSVVFPFIDAIRLCIENRNLIMMLHVPLSFLMAGIIVKETIMHIIYPYEKIGIYQ